MVLKLWSLHYLQYMQGCPKSSYEQMSNLWLSFFRGTEVLISVRKQIQKQTKKLNKNKTKKKKNQWCPQKYHYMEHAWWWTKAEVSVYVVGKRNQVEKGKQILQYGLIDWFLPLKHSTHSVLICVRLCCELILRDQKVVTHPHTVIDEAGEAVGGGRTVKSCLGLLMVISCCSL